MEYIFSLPMTIGSFLINAVVWGTICYLCMSWIVDNVVPTARSIVKKVLNRGE